MIRHNSTISDRTRLNREQKRKYIDGLGLNCPYCGSSDIEGTEINIEAGGATQSMVCLDCDKGWVDVYELINIIEEVSSVE